MGIKIPSLDDGFVAYSLKETPKRMIVAQILIPH